MTAAPATAAAMQRSHGVGTLAVKFSAERTRIDRLHQSGNAKIRVPKTHGEALEAVLINTAGGVTGGDTLSWTLEAGPETKAVVTTQACERVYRSAGGAGLQDTVIAVGRDASLFWLPQETIMFDGGRFRRTLDVTLAENARFIGLETLVFGREAMGETVASGLFHDRWRIKAADGKLVHADDLRFEFPSVLDMGNMAQLGANRVVATLVAVAADDGEQLDLIVKKARMLLKDAMAGVSRIGDGGAGKLVIRLAAPSSHALRKHLVPLLGLLLDGPALPRVWNL